MPVSHKTSIGISVAIAAALILIGLFGLHHVLRQAPPTELARIQASGQLIVATRRGPTTYHPGPQGPDGFEHALIQRFAEAIGVEARFVFPSSVPALLDDVALGRVHMATAALMPAASRLAEVRFSDPYEFVTEQVVYRRGSPRPRSLADIADGDLHVVADSNHEQSLLELRDTAERPLSWTRHQGIGPNLLLRDVDRGVIGLTIADSNELDLSRRIYKHLATAFELGEPRPLAWAFAKGFDDSLLTAANEFLHDAQQDGSLQRLKSRYFGHAGRLNFVETRNFWRQVRDRLPYLRPHFEEASQVTGIDWRLLAAIGYQESHWRSDAVSPTGVRGIMMLTRKTAKQMGVRDRNDPQQSITGGARYLRVVEAKIPARIGEPNRLWLTLAGYNIGFGHLEDARILTERDGANPDLWIDVKQRLPLLMKKAHYRTVRHGFARGQEAVDYVENIRNYYDLLVWFTTTKDEQTRLRLVSRGDT